MPQLTRVAAVSALVLALAPPQTASAAQGFGLGSLYSCDASGSANTTGAVIGGLVGALAGSQISKNERALGAVIGAGIGSAIGNNLGCRMDRKAQLDAQAAFQGALDTGQAQAWSDPATGATGRVEVLGYAPSYAPSYTTTGGARWRFAEGVTPALRVSGMSGAYAANGRVNVRAAPNTQAAIVDRLRPGEQVQVAGSVAGGWLAVVEDGQVQGYVARGVVQSVGGDPSGDCRVVEQTVSERGQNTTRERFNACRDETGSWRLNAI